MRLLLSLPGRTYVRLCTMFLLVRYHAPLAAQTAFPGTERGAS